MSAAAAYLVPHDPRPVPEPRRGLQAVPAAVPVPHDRQARGSAVPGRRARHAGARRARAPLRPARPPSAPRRRPSRCSAARGRALVEERPELDGDDRRRRASSPQEGWFAARADPGRAVVRPRGPHPARAGRARALRRDRGRGPHPARLRRPARRRPRRRDAGRRLQDRPLPERAVRGQGAVPDEVLRPGALAHPRRDPAPAPAGLPRQRRGRALRARRGRPARHRAQRPGHLGCRGARRADRRLAPAHLAAVRLVRLPRPLPGLGRHASPAARGRRAPIALDPARSGAVVPADD